MRFKNSTLSVALVSSLFLFGCSQDKTETPKSEQSQKNESALQNNQSSILKAAIKIQVLNRFGEPIQAKILIGTADGIPFKGNFIATDAKGLATVPMDWTTPQHVTIDAAGYIRQTLLNQVPSDLTIKLNPNYLASRAEIKGQVTNLPVVNNDKFVDFALVMPGMSRSDLLNFDLNSVISPYNDSLTAAGQTNQIPSNIALPTQKESYIIPVTLTKPIYRMFTPTLGPKRVFAARGRFPFKEVVSELRKGKPFYELINYFSIQGGGFRDLTLLGQSTNLDFPGNEIEFKSSLTIQPPTANSDEVLLVLAVSDVANSLIPTDIKKVVDTNALTLSSLADKPAFVVSVIKRQAEFMTATPGADRLSAALTPYTANMKPILLPLVENPSIKNVNGFEITMPNAPLKSGINSLAISATISDIVEIQNGTDKITNINHRWEIIGLGWSPIIQLPNWPLADMATKKRIEINFLGSTTNTTAQLDESLIQAATHVTHASTDF
ncbi:MAG: hypothetical protein WA160_10605 [Pseudobdellovibrio sp.]